MKSNNTISYQSPCNLASLPKETSVLVAFSGGADSSALLHLIVNDAKANGFTVHAAHFHHGIRDNEADRDAAFCKSVAQKYGIPFYLAKADVPALAKEHGNSLENEAREQRYAFFEQIMRENDIPILVTAHHAEDNAESIMLHILRGSGIAGLRGIQKCRPFANDFKLVRPLLECKKQDILDYCEQNNVEFVTDSTNFDTNYSRNALRNLVFPHISDIQPKYIEALARLSENATEADDFINESARSFLENQDSDNIKLNEFNNLHHALKVRILAITFEENFGASLEKVHIDDLIKLCTKATPHTALSLPNKIRAKIENEQLCFENETKINANEDFSVSFCTGDTALNGVLINIEKNPKEKSSKDSLILDVKCDLIDQNASFRSKNDGDTILSGKMNKKVKKLLNEKKIPLEMRKKIPLLVQNNEILWIASVAVCDRIKQDKIKDGEDFYRITVRFEN